MKDILKRILIIACLFIIALFNSQLSNFKSITWMNPALVDKPSCNIGYLLNYNCNITYSISTDNAFPFSNSGNYFIFAVHEANEEGDFIWSDDHEKKALYNTNFLSQKKSINIPKKPSIFSYKGNHFGKFSSADKRDSIDLKVGTKNLYEFILCNGKMSDNNYRKILTYLSIKYGISLKNHDYIRSDGKLLWSPKRHKSFSYRLTAIGRDDKNKLYQKQSMNQEDKILSVGLNHIEQTNIDNESTLNDGEFITWSDNNNSLTFKEDKQLKYLARIWEINFIDDLSKSRNYSILFHKDKLGIEDTISNYQLILNEDGRDIEIIQGIANESDILFQDVNFRKFSGGSVQLRLAKSNNQSSDDIQLPLVNSEVKPSDEFIIYPNPVKMNQIFTIILPHSTDKTIKIFDENGRFIRKIDLKREDNKFEGSLPVQGIYIIQIEEKQKSVAILKLIVR